MRILRFWPGITLAGCMEDDYSVLHWSIGSAPSRREMQSIFHGLACRRQPENCGGPYWFWISEKPRRRLIDRRDWPRTVLWYSIPTSVGRSDAKMPTFAFRGPQLRRTGPDERQRSSAPIKPRQVERIALANRSKSLQLRR